MNFALTIFVSAFLLFQVQPLISKFILPWFGGGPAVWTTCMLFFQTLLFAGYAYAHFSVRWLPPSRQAAVHLVLLVGALAVTLPSIAPAARWKPEGGANPTWSIMVLLTMTVGLPYLLLSATGPLLQAWFARSFPGRSPYRLYALSNVGSLLALVSYPFLVEPAIDTYQQSRIWAWAFALFVVLCGYAAVSIWGLRRQPLSLGERAAKVTEAGSRTAAAEEPRPLWYQPLLWIALPAFASMMLLATTNHVCQDVAVIPFLWVVPLSLYLLSFIISFDAERWYVRPLFAVGGLFFVYLAAAAPNFATEFGTGDEKTSVVLTKAAKTGIERWYNGPNRADDETDAESSTTSSGETPYKFEPELDYSGELVVHFLALFCICMICHGELVRLRPAPRFLTSFYLMIAAGGALGGLFVSLIAPYTFRTYYEWKLGIYGGVLLTAAAFLLSTGVFQHFDEVSLRRGNSRGWSLFRWSAMLLIVAVPGLVLSGIAWSDVAKLLKSDDETSVEGNFFDQVIARARNFYGAVRIEERTLIDPDKGTSTPYSRTLYHGRIIHGLQYLDEDRTLATTYYAPESGVGRAIGFFRSNPQMRVGAVGLGTGTIAAYCTEPGYYFRFYEINPKIEELSREYFSYRENAKGQIDIVLGDARLSLEREAATGSQRFDVLALDAFSGDAIPAHLLTREAFELYLKHVNISQGIIAVHISNRYLDLVPVVRGLAEEFKLGSIRIHSAGGSNGAYSSEWICVTNNQEFLDLHAEDDEYDGRRLPEFMFYADERRPHAAFETIRRWPRSILWTDAYSNLFDILMRKQED
jgi:hypothetical protein